MLPNWNNTQTKKRIRLQRVNKRVDTASLHLLVRDYHEQLRILKPALKRKKNKINSKETGYLLF